MPLRKLWIIHAACIAAVRVCGMLLQIILSLFDGYMLSVLCTEDWPLGVALLLGRKSVAVLTFDDHLNMRKLMAPAFRPKALARVVPRLVELAEEHCACWAAQGNVMGAKAIKAFTFHVSSRLSSSLTLFRYQSWKCLMTLMFLDNSEGMRD